ncbi:MAG: CoA transferase [Deltaproteobacteria bacterium]|nr:CoA transferase [Deltaproteobacteria bacterium]
MIRPLEGISVLAAEQMHALPHATQLMALMGATVLKVEPLEGEAGRHGRPTIHDTDGRATGSTFLRNNLAKQSIAIDLKRDEGRALFFELAGTVDVVAENFRPGAADKLGIGWAALSAIHPRLVYVSISGFGNRTDPPSPYRDRAAYAPIVEGMAGLYEYARDGDAPPRPASAGALGDTAPGLHALIGILAALRERDRTGSGLQVDVSMYDSMIAVADVVHPASLGVEPSRATQGIGILHAFRARDGWFTVEVVREPHFPGFAAAVGHPEWTRDPRLATRKGWSDCMETLIRPGVETWAAGLSKSEASAALAARGVAAGPVNTAADIAADPHVRARDFILETDTPEARVRIVGNPIAFRRAPGAGESHTSDKASESREVRASRAPLARGTPIEQDAATAEAPRWPRLGQHTDSILSQRLGLPPARIAALRAAGVVA